MSTNLKDYEGALKYAFAQTYASQPKDWTVSNNAVNEKGRPTAEFTNAALGITLQVTDGGAREDGAVEFSAKRVGADDVINMAVPSNWKHLRT